MKSRLKTSPRMSPLDADPPGRAWRTEPSAPSLPEVHGSVTIAANGSFWKRMAAFAGPGYLIAVGYMDPGNWATDLQGGAQFGYTLLSVILISNFVAILLQHLSIKLGVATGRDLAQACRDHYPRPVAWFLWILAEIGICACDLAEVVGTAIGLKLLFGIPLIWGCGITAADILVILLLQNKGFRFIEALVVTLIGTISLVFAAELVYSRPHLGGVLGGFLPTADILKNKDMLYASIGIFGATVMPHNLYLHSSIVQTRKFEPTSRGRREAIRYSTVDVVVALTFALFINAAILILAAATFHGTQYRGTPEIQGVIAEVQDVNANPDYIQDAYKLLSPLLGVVAASTIFALGLLAAGQNSTLTGTLAGQVVMEGFLNFRLPPWLRRLATRLIAIVPAVLVIACYGEARANDLIVFSQVILSMQLGFAVWPLVRFTGDRLKMGEFANPRWLQITAWATTGIIIVLNVKLAFDSIAPAPVQKAVYGFFGLPTP